MRGSYLLAFFLFVSPLWAQVGPLTVARLKFEYRSFDGGFSHPCRHKQENEFGMDWAVECGPDFSRKFGVHLKLSAYPHKTPPRLSYELLYWVADRNNSSSDVGSTTWFHLEEHSPLHSVQVSQSVDNDLAGLYLTISK
ncbi:hypothetical protein GW915_07145 [bacterium]|nr:hypothetical protein [bacterium]